MIEIIIATRNPHKFRELTSLLAVPGVRFRSLDAVPHLAAVPERGRTFHANAVAKARTVARAAGGLALADDSGLEVMALEGAPGVRSARFAGPHGDDAANNRKLLRMLAGLPLVKRAARYRCVLALASPTRLIGTTDGTCEGRIALAPKGSGGFGYDPLFWVPRIGRTVAQLSVSAKHRISHRAAAARRMQPLLRRLVRREKASAATPRGRRIRRAASGAAVDRG